MYGRNTIDLPHDDVSVEFAKVSRRNSGIVISVWVIFQSASRMRTRNQLTIADTGTDEERLEVNGNDGLPMICRE
jgi:hypothetical protein